MAARKIKLKDQLGRVINVPGATAPAATVTPPATQPDTARPAATVWKLIREIPANIQKLAKLLGSGFTTRGPDGEWHQRSITQGEGIAITNGDGVDGDPTVALAELADAGGGILQKTLRDGYGRVAGTSAATTTDLSEGSNLYYTDVRAEARAAAAVAAHVAEPDPHPQYTTAIEAAAAAPVQSVNGQFGAVVLLVPKGYIDGLAMQWGSANQLIVSSGAAYIPNQAVVVEVAAPITKSGLSLAASTWHHVYLYSNMGAADVEVVTTAPASPYSGTARTKTGDTSRRYLGSILADAGATIFRFAQTGDQIDYVVNPVAPFRVLSGGTATSRTGISLSGVMPVTSMFVIANTINNTDVQVFIDIPEIGNSGALSRYTCLANQRTPILAAVASRTLQYLYGVAPSGSGAFIDVWGYRYGR